MDCLKRVDDDQRNQLLRKLIGAELFELCVIRWKSVGLVVAADEVIGRGLGGGIGPYRSIGCRFSRRL